MYPPIFATVSADAGVTALLGSVPNCRFFLFGQAPQGVTKPYAVWRQISGRPENYLGKVPDIDQFGIQVDVYADSASGARAVAEALRDAIEPVAHITFWRGDSTDPETKNKVFTFEVDWFVNR
jgi:hypothetical protein